MRRALVVLLIALSASAAMAGEWGSRGISAAYLVAGTKLYAADGRGVTVYDIADPAHLATVDVEAGDFESRDLALMGTGDLVVATAGGVDRFALGSDGMLTRLGSWPLAGGVTSIAAGTSYAAAVNGRDLTLLERDGDGFSVRRRMRFGHPVDAVAFVGDVLYVSVETEGTQVFAAPSATLLKTLAFTPTSFSLEGDTLWASGPETGIRRIDVSNPKAPSITGRVDLPGVHPLRISVAGAILVAAEPPGMVRVYTLDQNGLPALQSTIDEPVRVVAATPTHVFFSGAALDDEQMPLENGLALRAYDVRTPSAPSPAGEVAGYAGPVSGVWTDGSLALVVDRPYLRVLDVSTTAAPRQIGEVVIPGLQDHIRVKNGLAVLYGRNLVNFVDVSNPAAPRFLGSWFTQGHPPSVAAIADGRAVEANMHSGLHVLDYTDPANAIQVGGRIWHYSDMTASDDAVYAVQDWGVIVLEIANRSTIVDRDRLPVEGTEQVEIAPPNSASPRFLILRGAGRVQVYDLTNRYSPLQTADLSAPGAVLAGTGDGVAWIAAGGLLQRLDLAQPAALEASAMRVIAPMQISVAGEKIVVADRYSVRVFGPDTAPPGVPAPAKRRTVRH